MAVKAPQQKILATVKWISEEKENEYGAYVSVLCVRSDLEGDAAKVWVTIQPEDVGSFRKGQQVNVIPGTSKTGKQKWDVELIGDAPSASAPPTAPASPTIGGHVMTDDLKRQVAAYVGEMAPLYAYCYQQAQAQLAPHNAPDAAVQAAASSLFIAAQRRFNAFTL